jgi:hypothetical protein
MLSGNTPNLEYGDSKKWHHKKRVMDEPSSKSTRK